MTNDSKRASDRLRELVIRMRDDAAANGDFRGAAELDEQLRDAFPGDELPPSPVERQGVEW